MNKNLQKIFHCQVFPDVLSALELTVYELEKIPTHKQLIQELREHLTMKYLL